MELQIVRQSPIEWEIFLDEETFGCISKIVKNKDCRIIGYEVSIKTMNGRPFFKRLSEAKNWVKDIEKEWKEN